MFVSEPEARSGLAEREVSIDNLLVRMHFIIVMIRWTGLAPWQFEFPFPGSLTSTFLAVYAMLTCISAREGGWCYRGTSPIRKI